MKCYVGIATSGRMDILGHALASVAAQTQRPETVFVCTPAQDAAVANAVQLAPELEVKWLEGPRGSCAQRNVILDQLRDARGVLLIMDDDFILAPDYLARLRRLMAENPQLAIVNGALAGDGISGPGIAPDHVPAYLERARSPAEHEVVIEERESIYGCNMAINLEHVHDVRFDEALPLYGWQEDVDFSRRLRQFGTIARTNLLAGVHLGVKIGRTSGVRFGYSQIANPIYLLRKGTMTPSHAGRLISKNLAMNVARALKPEPYIDRRGRLKGNILAFVDLLRRRLEPGKIMRL